MGYCHIRLSNSSKPQIKTYQNTNSAGINYFRKISTGKPHPEGYLKAASLLNVEPSDCLVFEDSPQGIRAALGAGMKVIALSTTFPVEALSEAHACINNYESLSITINGPHISVKYRYH